jgi:anti-sigma factor (TIGR02949 family)
MTHEHHPSATVDCGHALEKIFDLLDDELDADLGRQVREHLTRCPKCFGRAEFERRFLAAVQAARAAQDTPGALRERVLASLRAEGWQG